MSGKGSGRRPSQISDEEETKKWEMAFGFTCKRCGKKGLKPDSVHTCSPQIKKVKENER